MNKKNIVKILDFKAFIIPITIILVFSITLGITMADSIKSHIYNNIKVKSINFAKSYSLNLSKSTEAYDIINKLLEEKILTAGELISIYHEQYSNQLLQELAKKLEVDEIYAYNANGEIINSNNYEYIGWNSYEGHPVHDFIISDKSTYVEDIRKDSESDRFYKYGYIRLADECIIQVGVLAENIHDFIGSFETQRLLSEMAETVDVALICLYDKNFNIIGSADKFLVGEKLKNEEIKAEIISSGNYSEIINIGGENYYDVYVPVSLPNNESVTLHVRQSIKDTDELIRRGIILGLFSITIVLISISYSMISLHNKNKTLVQLAYYDKLTELPNREYLIDFITDIVKKNKQGKNALLAIRIENYRNINLTYGIHYSDKVIQAAADKLKELSNSYKMIFRSSGSRFVIFTDDYKTREQLVEVANKICELFNSPLVYDQYTGVKIGIVDIDTNYTSSDEVFKNALIALDYIEDSKNQNYILFDKYMITGKEREELIENEIRSTLSEENTEKIYLEYQPQVDLKTNRIIGFEALARMKTESLGYVSPLEFIRIAEKNELIVPLGNFILKSACSFLSTLTKHGYSDVKVAVNISGIQLLREDFSSIVLDIVQKMGIKTSNLEFEITESILIDNYEAINDKLKSFRDLDIRIALDDFGTGYSSFSRLSELNIDCVKIDQYFISSIPSKDERKLITGDIISMSQKIGHEVVAEGVEVEEQRKYLKDNNCDIMQGYLFSKPVPEYTALELLRKENL